MKPIKQIRSLPVILAIFLAFGVTNPASAQGPITDVTIPVGTVVDGDVFLVGQDISIDGTVNGNVFIIGNQVTINGTVDGSLILISQNAGILGTVNGAVYATSLTLDLAPNASILRDLYVITVSLTSGSQSVIGRDLYAIGLDSGLNGQIGRDLHTVIGPIQLYNGLMTLLGYNNLTIQLHFEAPQPATSPSGNVITTRHLARLQSPLPREAPFDWGDWALNLLRYWVVLFVISMLAFWSLRKPLSQSGEPLQNRPWQSLGTGLLVLVIACAMFGVALLLTIIIFAIGLGLNYLGFWQISLALWVASFAGLAILLVMLWFFIIYGTKVIVIFFSATWLFRKIFKRDPSWLRALALLTGTILFALLRTIPYIGWIVDLLVTAAGLGSAWIVFRGMGKQMEPLLVLKQDKKATRPLKKK
jgi:hypothetical protein